VCTFGALCPKTEFAITQRVDARLADLGGIPLPSTPSHFGKLIAGETEKWGKVVKFAGIKAD
jgi:hypothetical protein